jgi:hypothetical protein
LRPRALSVAGSRLDWICKGMTENDFKNDVGLTTQPTSGQGNPPSSPSASNGEVICPQCGAVNPPGSKVCKANPTCGSFLPTNQAARTTGIYARSQPPHLKEHAQELMSGIASDLGGEAELSTLENSYVRKLGDIDITIRLLTHDIATYGLLTPGGKVRDVYDKLLAGLAAFDRYAQRVGLERLTKRVPSLSEVMDADGE